LHILLKDLCLTKDDIMKMSRDEIMTHMEKVDHAISLMKDFFDNDSDELSDQKNDPFLS